MDKEKKKMGRPTDNPKGQRIGFRVSDTENEMLEYCLDHSDMKKSDVLRMGIRLVYEKIYNDSKSTQ